MDVHEIYTRARSLASFGLLFLTIDIVSHLKPLRTQGSLFLDAQKSFDDVYLPRAQVFVDMAERQRASGLVIDSWRVDKAWMNPSISLHPQDKDKVVMIWRMPDKHKHDKIGYMWLDKNSWSRTKEPDMIELTEPKKAWRRPLVAEDARIFSLGGILHTVYNTHLSKYKKLYYAALQYEPRDDMFFTLDPPVHLVYNREFNAVRHQKNWTPFEFCVLCGVDEHGFFIQPPPPGASSASSPADFSSSFPAAAARKSSRVLQAASFEFMNASSATLRVAPARQSHRDSVQHHLHHHHQQQQPLSEIVNQEEQGNPLEKLPQKQLHQQQLLQHERATNIHSPASSDHELLKQLEKEEKSTAEEIRKTQTEKRGGLGRAVDSLEEEEEEVSAHTKRGVNRPKPRPRRRRLSRLHPSSVPQVNNNVSQLLFVYSIQPHVVVQAFDCTADLCSPQSLSVSEDAAASTAAAGKGFIKGDGMIKGDVREAETVFVTEMLPANAQDGGGGGGDLREHTTDAQGHQDGESRDSDEEGDSARRRTVGSIRAAENSCIRARKTSHGRVNDRKLSRMESGRNLLLGEDSFSARPYQEWKWGELRGGSPALPIDDSHYLSFFHSRAYASHEIVLTYFMGAYLFQRQPPFAITHISYEPIMAPSFCNETIDGWAYRKVDYVNFPMGFVLDDQVITVSYGRNDRDGWLLQLNRTLLMQSLQPVRTRVVGTSEWNRNTGEILRGTYVDVAN